MPLVTHKPEAAFCQMPFLYECALLRFGFGWLSFQSHGSSMRSLFLVVLCLIVSSLVVNFVGLGVAHESAGLRKYLLRVRLFVHLLTTCSPYQQLPQQQQSAGYVGPPGLPHQGLSQSSGQGSLNGLGPLSPRGPASPSNGAPGGSEQAFSQQLNFNNNY